MGNKLIVAVVGVVVLAGVLTFVGPPIAKFVTKRHSPVEELRFNEDDVAISIRYCRPYTKAREIFGGLVPYEEVWRTGANEATTIELNQDILVGGQALAAGRYALFTIPGPEEWTVIFNSVADQWGAFDYDESQDVVRATATVSANEELTNQFTIHLRRDDGGAVLAFDWDMTTASLPITIQATEPPDDNAATD